MAQTELLSDRPDAAIGQYEKVLQLDPANIIALNDLAYVLADTGRDPDRALMLAQKVKSMASSSASVDDTIGWAYYKKGMYRASLDYLNRAATGGTPIRKCHLAMTYIQIGDKQKASVLVQAALKEDPNLPEAQKALQLMSANRAIQ